MGNACLCDVHEATCKASGNEATVSEAVSHVCSKPNCSVVSELKHFCLLFNIEEDVDDTNAPMDAHAYFEHYVLEHADNDDRYDNKCVDSCCTYGQQYESRFAFCNRQQLHGYFYHSRTYEASKSERGRYRSRMGQVTLQTIHKVDELEEDTTHYTSTLHLTSTPTPQIEGKRQSSYNLSVQISRLLSPLAPAASCCTPVPHNEEELSQSLTNPESSPPPFTGFAKHDLCEEGSECDRVKVLLLFSQNVDPQHKKKKKNSEEEIERMKTYWDHYSDTHISNYTQMKCIHMDDDDSDDDEDVCSFMRNKLSMNDFQLLLHSHFYHCNIMKEENNRIKYVKETMHGQVVIDKFKPTMQAILSQSTLKLDDVEVAVNNVSQFGFEWQCGSQMAQFKNPKQEMLRNKYIAIATTEWNELLRQINGACGYMKSAKSKRMRLTVGEVIALKMYTDFDALQGVYRRAYYDEDENERYSIQRQFYHWNELLAKAVAKSRDIITQTLYHGIDSAVSVATFFGKYYGPWSTTKLLRVAKDFAGDNGRVLEIFPSFGRKGLDVSWISRFPDEQEVIYFDATFDIRRIFDVCAEAQAPGDITLRTLTVLKALQSINVNSTIMSFNENALQEEFDFDLQRTETFRGLNGSELISIFYLLYLQYKPCEWKQLVESHDDIYTQIALAKYRDQFAQLTQNVTTIRMECASELIKYFFSVDMDASAHTIKYILLHSHTHKQKTSNIRFETIIKLFPKCKQISIDGDLFDWSLSDFIAFLKKYNLDFSGIHLQDIFLRFSSSSMDHVTIAKKRLKHKGQQHLLSELAKLGWRFISASHLHRFGFEPQPIEKPFLILFMNEGRVYARSYSKRVVGAAPKLVRATTMSLMSSTMSNTCIEGDHAIVDYNPKHLFLSKHILNECHYKDELIRMLRHRSKNNTKQQHPPQPAFDQLCESVQTLILYPKHNELSNIIYSKKLVDLASVASIFPNVTDIYLRETTFNQRVCLKLIEFLTMTASKCRLTRIFYSINKQCAHREVAKLKIRLNLIKWDFCVIEQVAFRQDSL
eukprot:663325_1